MVAGEVCKQTYVVARGRSVSCAIAVDVPAPGTACVRSHMCLTYNNLKKMTVKNEFVLTGSPPCRVSRSHCSTSKYAVDICPPGTDLLADVEPSNHSTDSEGHRIAMARLARVLGALVLLLTA